MPDTRQGTENASGDIFTGGGRGAWNQGGRRALKITAIYTVCGFLWIILSDRLLGALVRESAVLTRLQTYKGWIFILVTASLVYFLSRRALLKTERLALITRESERRFRALFENVSVVALVIDPSDGSILDANEAATKFYGWTREELRAMRITQINILAAGEVRARMDEATSRKQGFFLFKHRRSDGSIRNVEVYSGPIQFEGKTALYSFIHDVTERNQAEEALRESEEKFKALVETSYDWIWEVDEQGVYTYASPRVKDILGYTAEEVVGKTPFDLMPPGERERVAGQFEKIMLDRSPLVSLENTNLHKDGRTVILETNGMPIFDQAGVFKGYRGTDRDITERKRAEEDLRKSEEHFRTITMTASDAILLMDDRGKIVHWNPAAVRMFGYSVEEALGKDLHLFLAPHRLHEDYLKGFRNFISTGQGPVINRSVELTAVKKDGAEFPIEVSTSAMNVNGRWHALGIVRDITGRKQSESALRESEAKYRRLYNETPVLLHSINREGVLVEVNDYWLKTLGYERSEAIGRKAIDFYTDASKKYAQEVVHPAFFRDGVVKDVPFQFVKKSGEIVEVLLSATAERDAAGNVLRSQAMIVDITERKRAEEALRAAKEYAENLIETANTIVVGLDVGGEITVFNHAAETITGYTRAELQGKNWFEVLVPRTRYPHVWAEFEKLLNGGLPKNFENPILTKSGKERYIVWQNNEVYEEGRIAGSISFGVDITERRLLEEERLKTQKLESVGTLAGGIAHDFNNLLQGIFGYISMARMTIDQKDKSLAMLEQAEKALHHSVNLTTQLLTFSKGGKPVKWKIALAPVIENAVRFALSGSRADGRIEIDHDLSPVEADEGQIAQVLQNLVLNADQAMPTGGIVKISAGNVQAPGPGTPSGLGRRKYVRISVANSGVGIPEQYLAKIFDPYFTTKEKGSGLGLATSYSIIRNHDGVIDVRSRAGAGSTFTIYLPAAEGGAQPTAPVTPAPPAMRRGRVLVMDDEEVVRKVAGELIHLLGHDAEFAGDGKAAIEKFRAAKEAGKPFDVVILDLTIRGGRGGIETMRMLREIDPGVKAVVSSGYSDDGAVSDRMKHGFRAFLKKPYHVDALREILNTLLE